MALIGALGTLLGALGTVEKAQALTQCPAVTNTIQALEQGDLPGARAALTDPVQGLGVEMEKNDIKFPGTTLPPSAAIEQMIDNGLAEMNKYVAELAGDDFAEGDMVRINGMRYYALGLSDLGGFEYLNEGELNDMLIPAPGEGMSLDLGDLLIPLIPEEELGRP